MIASLALSALTLGSSIIAANNRAFNEDLLPGTWTYADITLQVQSPTTSWQEQWIGVENMAQDLIQVGWYWLPGYGPAGFFQVWNKGVEVVNQTIPNAIIDGYEEVGIARQPGTTEYSIWTKTAMGWRVDWIGHSEAGSIDDPVWQATTETTAGNIPAANNFSGVVQNGIGQPYIQVGSV